MRQRDVTVQMIDHPRRRVVQTVEPEAARLLIEKGGTITRYDLHGIYYWEYQPWEDHSVLCWPPDTLAVYVSARGQEDSIVVFAAFRFPACTQELHIVYDYRPSSLSTPSFEEFFTLRVAQEEEFVLREVPELLRL